MQILILNGAPKKNGHTARLLSAVTRNLPGEHLEIPVFDAQISPCIDCGYCKTHKGCCLRDDMQDIYEGAETADVVLLAAPVYFGNLPGPFLNIQSRFQPYFSDYHQLPAAGKIKKGAIVLTAGGSGGWQQAEDTARRILRLLNAQSVGTAIAAHTDTLPAHQDPEAQAQAAALVPALLGF